MTDRIPYKTYLSETEMPQNWYNIKALLKEQPAPMLHPATLQPCTKEDLLPIFCEELAEQELNKSDLLIPIPEEIQAFYKMYRPSPLVRAYCLEKALDTPAHIYYKFEGANTSGSHKLNSAAAQVYYGKKQGLKGITTETGAGQWGTALAMACAYFRIPLKVYMVKISSQQKPYRKAVMETYGAEVIASPSDTTNAGRKILAQFPDTGGSLGCAISEAIEAAVTSPGYRYMLGSVLDHVIIHQSVIGQEAHMAFAKIGEYPDIIIGCAGGGSNLGGLIAPFVGDKLAGKASPYLIAVEPASCPSFSRGQYAYDFGDTAQTTPLIKMYTLGSAFIPSPNHSGGLRYHGMSPIVSKLYHDRILDEARAVEQGKVFEAAVFFAKNEGLLPAPESSHAIRVALDEAIKCKESGEAKTILFGLSGTGYFDMTAYQSYHDNALSDYIPNDDDLAAGFASLPQIPK